MTCYERLEFIGDAILDFRALLYTYVALNFSLDLAFIMMQSLFDTYSTGTVNLAQEP